MMTMMMTELVNTVETADLNDKVNNKVRNKTWTENAVRLLYHAWLSEAVSTCSNSRIGSNEIVNNIKRY